MLSKVLNSISRIFEGASEKETYQQVKKKFKINEIGPTQLKGKRDEIMVYEVVD